MKPLNALPQTGSTAARRVAQRPNTIALMGDSITWFGTEWNSDNPVLQQNHSRGAFPWANAFLRATNQGLTLAANFAIPAQAMGDMIPQMDQMLALRPRPGYVLLHAGINNIISDLPFADLQSPWNTIADRCEAAGIRMIATTLLAGSSTEVLKSASRRQKYFAFNAWVREQCAARGIALCDWHDVTADPGTAEPLPNTYTDGTHPAAPASFRAGLVLADTLRKLLQCCEPTKRTIGERANLIRNGTFAGYNGLRGDGVIGDVANGWTIALAQGGMASPMILPRTRGESENWQEVTLQCDDPSNTTLTQEIAASGIVGERIRATIELERGTYWQNISAVTLGVSCLSDSRTILRQSIDLSGADNKYALPDVHWRAVLETPSIVVPTGSTRVQIAMNLYGLIGAHGSVRAARAALWSDA